MEEATRHLEELRKEVPAAERITAAEGAVSKARREVRNVGRLANVLPHMSPVPAAMAVEEGDKPVDQAIRIHGARDQKGDVVPRAVPPLFDARDAELFATRRIISTRCSFSIPARRTLCGLRSALDAL